jgi:Lon protease-like protein
VELPIFPLNTVLFPGQRLPLHIFEERYKLMINTCLEQRLPFGVCLIREGREVGAGAKPFDTGTTAHIREVQRLEDGKLNIVCVGGERFVINAIVQETPYMTAEVRGLRQEYAEAPDASEAAAKLFAEYVRLNLAMTNQWARTMEMPSDAGTLADFIGARLAVDVITKQRLLEQLSPELRLQGEIEVLSRAVTLLGSQVQVARAARWQGFGVLN